MKVNRGVDGNRRIIQFLLSYFLLKKIFFPIENIYSWIFLNPVVVIFTLIIGKYTNLFVQELLYWMMQLLCKWIIKNEHAFQD
jgi:hypothetical protein